MADKVIDMRIEHVQNDDGPRKKEFSEDLGAPQIVNDAKIDIVQPGPETVRSNKVMNINAINAGLENTKDDDYKKQDDYSTTEDNEETTNSQNTKFESNNIVLGLARVFSSNCDKTIVGDQNGSSDSDQKEVAPKKKKEGIGDKSKHISDKNNESNTEYEESSNKDTSSKTKLRRGKKHLKVKPGENQELEKVPTKITEDNAAKKIVEKQKNYTLDEDYSENDTI